MKEINNSFSIGSKHGDWEIIEKVSYGSFKCKCNCGKIEIINKCWINPSNKKYKTKRCRDCLKRDGLNLKRIDLLGQKKESWTILEPAIPGHDIGMQNARRLYILCKCDCGTIKYVEKIALLSGKSRGCMLCRNKRVYGTKKAKTFMSHRNNKAIAPIKNLDDLREI